MTFGTPGTGPAQLSFCGEAGLGTGIFTPQKRKQFMSKIILGSAPKTFKRRVSFPLISGGKGDINVEYNYRNRTQFAAFIAEVYPELRDGPQAPAIEGVDVVANSAQAVDRDVKYILAAAAGWDLEDDFDAQSVRQLVNEFPAAANAIMADYRAAITEGKTGN